ncbi:hypothetical protein TRAPUB_12773, partial [Trametes pubescens]
PGGSSAAHVIPDDAPSLDNAVDVEAEAVEDGAGNTQLIITNVTTTGDALLADGSGVMPSTSTSASTPDLPAPGAPDASGGPSPSLPHDAPGAPSPSLPSVLPSLTTCPDKPDVTSRSMRAMFTRRRTHNEQLLLRPCGIIIKRATFYGSETTPQNLVRTTFPLKERLPRVLVYDNNCQLYKHSRASGETLHTEIGLPVDVFHWKCKHKKTDEACAVHCNPYAYPELRVDDDGNWFFNTSIAEQTNVWAGGFAPILREMIAVKYDFFMDEMIKERNAITKERLLHIGCLPNYRMFSDVPAAAL